MDGFFFECTNDNFDLALDDAATGLYLQLYPCVPIAEESVTEDIIVERQVEILEVIDGIEIYFHTVDDSVCATGSFSAVQSVLQNLDQIKEELNVSQLVLETPRDIIATGDIRSASYYSSDYAWNQYVRHRSPRRLYDVVNILAQLPNGRIVAPCDGPGIVSLASKILGLECYSSDINVGIARVMFDKIIKEDWTRTLQQVKLGDIIFLSHCEEMCPGIVQSFLSRGNMLVYYGKEPMFQGMEKMHQISSYLWSSQKLLINFTPVQLASDLYFGKMLKYESIGIMSEMALRNVRMLSLFSAQTSFSYFGDGSKREAFNSFMNMHGLQIAKKKVQVLIIYNANELLQAFARKPVGSVVTDMRVGRTYREFPKFYHFKYWSTMKCYRRKIYEFLGRVSILRGKGINIDHCSTGTCYTWFDKLGIWKILLEGPGIVHRLFVEVLD